MKLFFKAALLLLPVGILSAINDGSDSSTYFGGSPPPRYIKWVQSYGSNYTNAQFLASSSDASDGVALHWRIDKDRLHVAAAAKAYGWIALGISETGGMQGSDVVLFQGGDESIQDMHILDERLPLPDDCQDWTLESSIVQSDGQGEDVIIFQANRALDTGDKQDRPLIPDGSDNVPISRVVAAWGNDTYVSYHGRHVARSSVRWHRKANETDRLSFPSLMSQHAKGYFDLFANNYTVPAVETDYHNFCLSREEMLEQNVPNLDKIYVIGMEPIINPESAEFVHHFVVAGSSKAHNNGSATCQSDFYMIPFFVWAPGEPSFALPENVAAPIGFGANTTYVQSLQLEIHYNNPSLKAGVLDSSGVRFYYTTQPRQHDMGILQLGDPFVSLYGTPVGDGLVEHIFECPESCSSFALENSAVELSGFDGAARRNLATSGGVTVFREYLHMHKTGDRISNEQYRNGKQVHVGTVDFFNFYQQGNQPVQEEPFTILPGDSFRTTCQYNSAKKDPNSNGTTTFGLGSQEEMCIAFLYYYPRLETTYICGYEVGIPPCESTWENKTLSSSEDLNRTFGDSNDGQCPSSSEEGTGEVADANSSSSRHRWVISFLVGCIVFVAW